MHAVTQPAGSPEPSSLDAALVEAYASTEYRVWPGPGDENAFVLKVGQGSAPLAQLHRKFGVHCSAFLTACNPWSQALSEPENAARQQSLQEVLQSRSLRWVKGLGQHPDGQWPGEPSFLILGLSLAAARVLAEDFAQNALLWSGQDATPQLVLLR
jgi:hypothetical protein